MQAPQTNLVFLTPFANDAHSFAELLARTSLRVHHASTLAEAEGLLEGTEAPVLVTDTALPDANWQEALEFLARRHPRVLLVVTAAHADERLWAETINRGAFDLIPQPFYGPELRRILENAREYANYLAVRARSAAGN